MANMDQEDDFDASDIQQIPATEDSSRYSEFETTSSVDATVGGGSPKSPSDAENAAGLDNSICRKFPLGNSESCTKGVGSQFGDRSFSCVEIRIILTITLERQVADIVKQPTICARTLLLPRTCPALVLWSQGPLVISAASMVR